MTSCYQSPPYDKRKELQSALRNFLLELDLPYFVTIAFNQTVPERVAKRLLNEFHRNLQRRMFGKKFYKLPREQRIFFIAMPEHFNSNIHYHLLLRVPPKARVLFQIYAAAELHNVFKSADIHIAEPKSLEELRATKFYACKDLIHELNFDNFVISTEFQCSHKINQEIAETLAISKQ